MDEDREQRLEPEGTESDSGRRDFLSKALSVAGAVAAAGLVGAALSEDAEAQPRVRAGGQGEVLKNSPLRYQKTEAGHAFSIQGPEIAAVLAREGLIPQDAATKTDVGIFIMVGRRL